VGLINFYTAVGNSFNSFPASQIKKYEMDHSHHHEHQEAPVATAHEHHKETMHHAGHDKHAGHHTGDFLKRFWICLILTIPVLALSHIMQQWIGLDFKFAGDNYLLLLLGCIIYFYGGVPFFKKMASEIKDGAIGMMTLVAIAISVAFFYSVAVVFGLKGMDFFWELATLIDIMLLGHWIEMRSTMAASNALQSLVALLPSTVHVERNGTVTDVDVKELKKDDIAVIKPSEKIPADGVVIEGSSYVNESVLTGESVPV
jgi:Cu2+-exporting ATPase